MRLLVIPARGGSRRVPRKNVRSFAGRPMIAWSIEAALDANRFDLVIVSTDDEEIANLARAEGAAVPFVRPTELAGDHIATRPVIAHAIKEVGAPGGITCCLYPTAPFVGGDDLRGAVDLLESHPDVATVMTVTAFAEPVWRAFAIEDDRLVRLFPEHAETRSQDLPPAYRDAGQFYVARNERWLSDSERLTHGALPIVLPQHRAIDIDTEHDWQLAEATFLEHGSRPRPEPEA